MAISIESKSLLQKLMEPLAPFLKIIESKRNCPKLEDERWIETGLLRVLTQERSSLGFLQQLAEQIKTSMGASSFFKTLHSERRLKFCEDLNHALVNSVKAKSGDSLSQFKSLDGYDIYAGDGHYRAASVHEDKIDDKRYAVGHFYTLNLRTGMLTHLDSTLDEPNRKKEHDMHLLKRMTHQQLRQGAKKGRKVIYVWDCAGIDFQQWYKWKQASGIYFISLEKSNMKPLVTEELAWDRSNPINNGVLADEYIETTTVGVKMRRVRYQCPSSGKIFHFITSLMDVEPGLIAHLYKLRWNIEKVYDELKTKLCEKKAWAKGQTARNMQAQLTCLMHNLMFLLEKELSENHNLSDEKEVLRRKQRLELNKIKAQLRCTSLPLAQEQIPEATQRSHKFIRWLRNHCFSTASYTQAFTALRTLYPSLSPL
jgi:hypothetical protein